MTEAEGEKLLRENADLRALITKLTDQVAKLTERVAELLAVAQRRQRKPSAEKPPEPRPEVVGDAKQAFEQRPKPPKKTAPAKPPKKTVRPTGRKALPQHLETEEHVLRAPSLSVVSNSEGPAIEKREGRSSAEEFGTTVA